MHANCRKFFSCLHGSNWIESSVHEGASEGNYDSVGDCVLHIRTTYARLNTQRIYRGP